MTDPGALPDYFHATPRDGDFLAKRIDPRLPRRIVDAHMHVNLPEHVAGVSRETIAGDWALQCGTTMPYERARNVWTAMLPGREVSILGFPWPLPEADIPANNAYLAGLAGEGRLSALMTVRPEWDPAECERALVEGGFKGFKPYPYMASTAKGADVSIFDFLPRAQLDVLNRNRSAVLIHLPRRGRIADDANVAELKEIVDGWPDVRVALAHYGRAFNPVFLEDAARKLGGYMRALHFDCAAVLNPEVHALAFEAMDRKKIMFGSDQPIFMWHGGRRWTRDGYFNLCREDFPWNRHEEGKEREGEYTFFIYEQLANILDRVDATRDAELAEDLFRRNAERIYRLAR